MKAEESNRMIAEFMGFRVFDKRYPRNHGIGGAVEPLFKDIIVQKCKYHTSWDWLMPVVEKIESMGDVILDIHREATRVKVYISYIQEWKTTQWDNNEKINHVYKACIEYILWHNTHKIR